MPIAVDSLCPKCAELGTFLPAVSDGAFVNYYRCHSCGHVWTQDKKNHTAPPRDVTIQNVTIQNAKRPA